jgi:TonB family protein
MDAIVEHIWESTVVAIAAGGVSLILRRNSASVRYWIWFTAAVKFLVPFAALAALANQFALPQSPQAATNVLAAATIVFRGSALPAVSEATSVAIIFVWASGACVVIVGWLSQWLRLAACAAEAAPIVDGVVYDALKRMQREENIRRPIALVASNRTMEPAVIGIFDPVLLWPPQLTAELNDAHIDAIVAHEVCHVVRRDNLLALVQMVVSASFWFHPLVWWIGSRLIDERERACDEHVLARGSSAGTYAESIVKTCRICVTSPLVNAAGVTGGELKTRIIRIMKRTPAAPVGMREKTMLILAVLLLVVVPVIANHSPRAIPASPAQDKDREVERPGPAVTTPRLLKEVKPQYSARAMQDKVEGEVVMECVVKADGTVGDKKVVKSLDPDLDQAALDAAAQWIFEPGKRDGKPVNVLVTITMTFTLKKTPE